ncbi:hypothetical protein CXF83_21795 [Shewanella sp. Choline-02u-19]|uniref:hypothetical protein n=1 Tax=unclassified Shewanella TaxID=196818 RepID=UPI000C32E0BB|nr:MULTISPECIES: hypothetical protein [unclassified Shewanella]PKH60392.1 hypothetical protein CXF84_02600 [Shewanella sp. Bg11-22]PKI29151.1 hypothetical protein CXF83_21795 [Shewanella sp. Choline-02u-19]
MKLVKILVRNLNQLKKAHVKKLAAKASGAELTNWYKNADGAGLDYGSNVYSYGQVDENNLIENYVYWYSFYDDSTLANESLQKAHEESLVYVSIDSNDETFNTKDIKLQLRNRRKKMSKMSKKDIKW